MKKIILFISLIILVFSANAQTGEVCDSAINISIPTDITDSVITENEHWYSFTPSSTNVNIIIKSIQNSTDNYLSAVTLYSGYCSAIVVIASDSSFSSSDSVLRLDVMDLVIGSIYYLKINKINSELLVKYNLTLNDILVECPATFCNISPNPSFEIYFFTPPDNPNEINYACSWGNPSLASPDHLYLGSNPLTVGVPVNYWGNQNGYLGSSGYAGIAAYYTDPPPGFHEYIWQPLTTVIGQTYQATMYVSLSDRSQFEVNSLGMLFTTAPPWGFSYGPGDLFQMVIPAGSQLVPNTFPSTTFYSDKTNWIPITGTFTATATTTHLTIGDYGSSMASNVQPATFPNAFGPTDYPNAYYYIDHIIIAPINISVTVNSPSICPGETATITATGTPPGGIYSWSTGATPAGAGTALASPATTTTYTVTYTTCPSVTATAVATVTVLPLPIFTITGSFTSCIQDGGVLTPYSAVPSTGASVTYTWSTSTGFSGTGATANLNFYPNGGTVTFVATNTTTGCEYTESMYVGSCCERTVNPVINFTNISTTDIPSAYPGIGSSSGGTFTIVGSTFSINGTFTVNSNLTLKGCTVLMGYNAKIIVDPGKTLTITSASVSTKSHLYACDEMWDGIYVSSPTSLVIITNGSTVEDALNAIVSENKGNYKIFSLTAYGNVIFNKNYKSIVVKNDLTGTHPGLVRSTTIQCYDGVVGGNPVNTLNKLHFPHATERSFMGMEIINVNDITIGVPSVPLLNTFDNMDFGIKSTNSSLNVYNNDFKNITAIGAIPKGVECTVGTAICATGGKTVIRTINVGSTLPIPFYKNTFANDNKGVVATQFMNVNIWKNDFNNITSTGIRLSKNATNVIVVSQNKINTARVGIDCFDNQSANVTIDNNDIDAGTLLVASGVLAQEIIAGTTVYKITRNTIKNVRYGAFGIGLKNSDVSRNDVYLKHTTSPILECYGIRLANSSLCTVVSNRVFGTNRFDYWVQGISLDLCMSDYVTCNESHNLGTGMFFGGTQTPNTYIAKNLMNNNYRGFVLNFGIVGDQFTAGSPIKPNDNRWTGTFTGGCYTEAYISNGNLSKFFVRPGGLPYNVTPSSLNCGPLPIPFLPVALGLVNPIVCTSIFPGGGSPAPKPIMLKIAGDSIIPSAYDASTRWMLKQSLYQHLKVDPSTISTEPLIAQFKNDYTINNMGKLDDVETVLSDLTTATPSSLSSIQSINNTVVPASDVETNSKWMNNLLIENALTGSDYSASQISDLQILAAKCPYNDGQAVYQARVILSQIEDVEYLNACETATPGSHSMSPFSQPEEPSVYNDFKLFPNPNDGIMNFIYSLKEASQGEMIIYDLTGKAVANYQLATGLDNQILINETNLSNGVYFYQVIIDSEIKVSDKIVIIK